MKATTKQNLEFGGPIGTLFILLFSHFLVYYLWMSLTYYGGSLFLPSISEFGHLIAEGASPSWEGAAIYFGFMAFQFILAYLMPGIRVKGLPLPSEGNRQLSYLCNGIGSWYVTLLVVFVLNYMGIFRLSMLVDHMGSMITVGMLFANGLAIFLYLFSRPKHTPMGNIIYDFFMGVTLNPCVGRVDLKLFSEIRIPWILLFFLTISAAVKQYELKGALSSSMIFMVLAHGLYTNACMKGEECIPTTWDIFHEKFGWMLIFWNYVGVPFVYCFQSFYILKNDPHLPLWFMIPLFALLLIAYYVWDTANSQKNRFRMQLRGTYIKRRTFPQLPWGTLKNPKYIKTASGSALLTDGWYRYGRKIHYTADTTMAITWGLSCGFSGFLPYLYPLFFIAMITHRYRRDMKRCAEKYGADWEQYCQTVRYKFIPFVY